MSQTDSSRGQGFLRVQGRQNVQVARPGGQGCSLSRWGAAEGVTVGLKPAQAPCWNSVSKEGKKVKTKGKQRQKHCRRAAGGWCWVSRNLAGSLFGGDVESLLLFYFLKVRTVFVRV